MGTLASSAMYLNSFSPYFSLAVCSCFSFHCWAFQTHLEILIFFASTFESYLSPYPLMILICLCVILHFFFLSLAPFWIFCRFVLTIFCQGCVSLSVFDPSFTPFNISLALLDIFTTIFVSSDLFWSAHNIFNLFPLCSSNLQLALFGLYFAPLVPQLYIFLLLLTRYYTVWFVWVFPGNHRTFSC